KNRSILCESHLSEGEVGMLREARESKTDEDIAERLELGRMGKMEFMRRQGNLKKFEEFRE
ncbi:MAG: hypothetical protein ACQKBT_12620, partial [Puniceicoccales bacterium]